jgi:S-formylglutathione hydrolase FrmB
MPVVRPSTDWPQGKIVRFRHRSGVLADNPWGDPTERDLSVYLPPSYSDSGPPLAALWDLAAFTNAGPGHLNWRNQGENLPSRLDRLIGSGQMEPAAVVFPDCYTSLGGNQYVNSPAVGRYADYLVVELVPFVEERLNLARSRDGRAVFGKSSGGYGALYHVMHYPETWGAAASHAGDVGFDLLFRTEFPKACSVLANYDGDPLTFLRAFWRRNRPMGHDFATLLIVAMAASYDPDPEDPGRIRLPFDLRTCAIDPERWQHWLEYDPLNLLDARTEALRSLRGLYIDVGIYDQYHIQYGTRRLVDALAAHGIAHRYEEFDGTHSAIDWRLDHSLPFLSAALKNPAPDQDDA